MSDEDEGISKQAFAELIQVSPGRVSQLLSAGLIDGDALVGTGRFARIRPAVAREQLKARLDVGHRARASTKAQIDQKLPLSTASQAAAAPAPRAVSEIEHQIQLERLDGFRRDNRRKAEEEAARSGRYVKASDASRWFGKIAAALVSGFEGWLGEVASHLSAKFGIPQRDVLHALRTEFRSYRASAADTYRREAALLPVTIEDNPIESVPTAEQDASAIDGEIISHDERRGL
jgi:hypothetical protein